MNNKTIWILTGTSESGDDYGPDSFSEKPTQEFLKEWCHDCDGDDEENGPGNFGSYVSYELTEEPLK